MNRTRTQRSGTRPNSEHPRRHGGQRCLLARIGRLITGRAVRAVVDDHQDVVIRRVVGDCRQVAKVRENRAVTVDGDDRFGLRKCEAKANGRRKAHCTQHVKVGRLVINRVQLLRWDTDVANDKFVTDFVSAWVKVMNADRF